MSIKTFAVFLFSLFFLLSFSLSGADYYVAKTGNDSNGGSEGSPWLSIQKAANTLSGGDTVYIKTGTYTEQIKPQNSGSSGNYITYTAYSTDTVTLDGTGLPLTNYEGLFHIEDKNYIKVIGLRITNVGPNDNNYGINVDGSNYITVENCYTYNTKASGISAWSGSNITINNNEVELACNDGEQECITLDGVDTFEISNNHIHDSGPGTIGGEGIDVKNGSHDGSIHDNSVHDLNRLGIYVDAWTSHTYNIDIYNNIVYNINLGNDGFTLASEGGGLLQNVNIYNNIAFNCSGSGVSLSLNASISSATRPFQDITITNNTFYNNGSTWGGGIFSENPDATGVVIRNNICSQNVSFQIADEGGLSAANFVVEYNLIDGYQGYTGETYGTNYQTGSPTFVSTVTPDFHLQVGSPAIDNGTATGVPATDYEGNSRPQGSGYDIGAYEYTSNTDTVTVTAPNGGESWESASSQDITWTSTGSMTNVAIDYSTDNGSSWSVITASTANDGTYSWTVPNVPSTQCLVRVSDTDSDPTDSSDAVFSITAATVTPTITVTAPNGGESWGIATSENITWSSTGTVGNVMIEYSTNNGSSWTTISASTDNDGSYAWTVAAAASTQCLVRVSETDGSPTDSSDAVFTIVDVGPLPTITVTAPNGGESWGGTSSRNITWTHTETVGNVAIDYSTNNGSSWISITSSTDNDGTYAWTVPDVSSSNCLVRVEETDGSPTDSSDAVFTITGSGAPSISLSRTQLNFCAVGSAYTGAQKVLLENSGGGTLNWTAVTDPVWLFCTPDSDAGGGELTISVVPDGLAVGTYGGTVTITDAAADNSPQTLSVSLTVKSSGITPFGLFSTPEHGATVSSSIAVTGWVLDDVEVVSVKIYREGNGSLAYVGDAMMVEGARADVESAYPDYPYNYNAGWGYMMLTNFLPGGNGVFVIHAIATDKEGNVADLGSKTITVDNANAVKPFGAIDNPGPGGTASGASYRNAGWVLTPPPATIPTDGSTIEVYVDGVNLGNPTYNIPREDIAGYFPGYNNSDGAAAFLDIDTTPYENGVHTIYWIAADGVNADGIGSRFFNINNIGNRVSKRGKIAHIRNRIDTIPLDVSFPACIKKGGDAGSFREVYPGSGGVIELESRPMERVVVRLSSPGDIRVPGAGNTVVYCGYLRVGKQLRALPVGSTLDVENGVFYWQPGPGFFGDYHFVFIRKSGDLLSRKLLKVSIH
ncbi:MAG: hypothetical protein GY765_21285 [bacterium]|nr:hypothetical protein [bacterium]